MSAGAAASAWWCPGTSHWQNLVLKCCRAEHWKLWPEREVKEKNYKMMLVIHLKCCFQCSRPSGQCRWCHLQSQPHAPRSLQASPSRTARWCALEPAWRLQRPLQRCAPELKNESDLEVSFRSKTLEATTKQIERPQLKDLLDCITQLQSAKPASRHLQSHPSSAMQAPTTGSAQCLHSFKQNQSSLQRPKESSTKDLRWIVNIADLPPSCQLQPAKL